MFLEEGTFRNETQAEAESSGEEEQSSTEEGLSPEARGDGRGNGGPVESLGI